MVCRVYGAQKGCLIWEGHNGSPRLLCGLGMSIFDLDRRETASLPGGSQAEGFPCGFLLENSEGHAAFEIKIPIPFPDSGLAAPLFKGNILGIFPSGSFRNGTGKSRRTLRNHICQTLSPAQHRRSPRQKRKGE